MNRRVPQVQRCPQARLTARAALPIIIRQSVMKVKPINGELMISPTRRLG
ncbi:hypothetical protein ACFODZ_01805 [Marinicella sediminis]|uniref:Uncharacterized protein n=1 Tax=Marinicella sediminis TaxID=1792834 RepID=A0ABV7JA52_9GAMM|nr:hypothetical protein [Marinicella sediminis]